MSAPTLTHEVHIDLDASGAFETNETLFTDDGSVARFVGLVGTSIVTQDPGEDVTADVRSSNVVADRGRDAVASLMPPFANEFRFPVRNPTGRYTPTNAGSDLYPNVRLGRLARWRIAHGGIAYPIVTGRLTDIHPNTGWGAETVDFVALSQLARLVGITGRSSELFGDGTLAGGIRTDEALRKVFAAGGMVADELFDFDQGETVLLWFRIRPADELFELAVRLWATEGPGAQLYDKADGLTAFRRRSALQTDPRSNTPQAIFRSVDDGANPWYAEWEPGDGEEHVVNLAQMTHVRRVVDAADAALWRFGAPIVLAADEARTFAVAPATDDPIASVLAPVLGTDYTVTAGAVASFAFDRGSGPFVTLTVTASPSGASLAGPTGTPADGLTVRGRLARAVAVTPVTDEGLDTADSLEQYGPKSLKVAPLGEIDYEVAQSLMNGYVARGQAARATARLRVPLASDVLAGATLGLEVGDRIAVQNDRGNFSQEMWIHGLNVLVEDGKKPLVTIACEAVYETGYGLWDAGAWGATTFTDDGSVARLLGLAGTTVGTAKWGV